MLSIIVSALSALLATISTPTEVEGSATYAVSMTQMNNDVVYNLKFVQLRPTSPGLMECDYLIEWQPANMENKRMFTSFSGGNHFRYSGGEKLQEYHAETDSSLFVVGGGIQQSAQFIEILPVEIGKQIKEMSDDSMYSLTVHSDTLIGGVKRLAVDAVMKVNGNVIRKREYVFDKESYAPVRMVFENNIGQVSEQTVTVEYGKIFESSVKELNEEHLMEKYDEVFSNFRRANFRIDKLKGRQLPALTLPTTTGERYSRERSDAFRAPTVVVMMESGAGFNSDLVKQVRSAVDALPLQADVLWVFADSDIDSIESTIGELREGEHALISGRGFLRDCGASNLPSVLVCDETGKVAEVKIGYNNDVDLFVIQNIAIMQ